MLTKTRYISTENATEGMVLAEPVKDRLQRVLMPASMVLTEENVHQLCAHCIEFVCITEVDTRTPEQIARDAQQPAASVQSIFDKADLSSPSIDAMFKQVLRYRTGQ